MTAPPASGRIEPARIEPGRAEPRCRCLVVGARGAIGAAVAARLAPRGWSVVGTSSRAAACAGRDEGDPEILPLDLTQPSSVADCPLTGTWDAVVVAAGMPPTRALRATTPEHLARMMAIHVTGPVLLMARLADRLRPGAAVVLCASVAAFRGSHDPAYAAAKGAVVSLVRSLSRDLAPGARVNGLAPSLVAGSATEQGMTPDFRDRHLASTPLERLVTPDDCAEAVEFLIRSPHATGLVLPLNGGQHFH
jgi:3-oxoacyl-[acyl-carrier protein] reductase